jgi:hypothetical protein
MGDNSGLQIVKVKRERSYQPVVFFRGLLQDFQRYGPKLPSSARTLMRAAGKTIQPSCGEAEELGYYRLLVVDSNGERTAQVFFFHVQGPASPRTSRRARLTGRFANLGGTVERAGKTPG